MEYRVIYNYKVYKNGTVENKNGHKMAIKNNNKESLAKYKRPAIRLSNNGNKKEFVLARLVYCLFNDIDYNTLDTDKCVTYKNGNQLDCNLSNLKLVDRKDLIQGEKSKSSVLTDKEIKEIRTLYNKTKDIDVVNQHDVNYRKKNSLGVLAKKFRTTKQNINSIVHEKSRNVEKYILK